MFASLVAGRKILKNVWLKGRQIIYLLGAPTCVGETLHSGLAQLLLDDSEAAGSIFTPVSATLYKEEERFMTVFRFKGNIPVVLKALKVFATKVALFYTSLIQIPSCILVTFLFLCVKILV